MSAPSPVLRRWLDPGVASFEAVTELGVSPVLGRPGRAWWIAVAATGVLTLVMIAGMTWSFMVGPGAWGNDTAVVWGFPIASFVWWVGVGHAGTLISSLLLLTRQKWRASINRFAEAMTLFAVVIAGLFPILHLGRQSYFLWIAPIPNSMGVWPQWRSALVWDFSAILSYLLFSALFFYVGLIPDLATVRDRARRLSTRRLYGALALGWRGTRRQWGLQRRLHRLMAGVALPLVVSVHSIVALDFAAGITPGWHDSLFPPYFVVGALFSGFAMVAILALWLRRALGLQALITPAHFDAIARIILAASLFMGLAYATEAFMAAYGGEGPETRMLGFQYGGPYGGLQAGMIACNVLTPQALWSPRLRRAPRAVGLVAVLVLIGMYLERIQIVISGLSHSYSPSLWRTFAPTLIDLSILIGSIGFFALLMLLFSRLFPVISLHDVRELVAEEAA